MPIFLVQNYVDFLLQSCYSLLWCVTDHSWDAASILTKTIDSKPGFEVRGPGSKWSSKLPYYCGSVGCLCCMIMTCSLLINLYFFGTTLPKPLSVQQGIFNRIAALSSWHCSSLLVGTLLPCLDLVGHWTLCYSSGGELLIPRVNLDHATPCIFSCCSFHLEFTQNIGGTNAWAVPTTNFGGTVPPVPL